MNYLDDITPTEHQKYVRENELDNLEEGCFLDERASFWLIADGWDSKLILHQILRIHYIFEDDGRELTVIEFYDFENNHIVEETTTATYKRILRIRVPHQEAGDTW